MSLRRARGLVRRGVCPVSSVDLHLDTLGILRSLNAKREPCGLYGVAGAEELVWTTIGAWGVMARTTVARCARNLIHFIEALVILCFDPQPQPRPPDPQRSENPSCYERGHTAIRPQRHPIVPIFVLSSVKATKTTGGRAMKKPEKKSRRIPTTMIAAAVFTASMERARTPPTPNAPGAMRLRGPRLVG
jgi:hypothetical protein